jgi:hypothetical protein
MEPNCEKTKFKKIIIIIYFQKKNINSINFVPLVQKL